MKILCFAIDDFIKNREKMDRVIGYGLNHNVSDIYIFSLNVVTSSLLDTIDLVPKSGMNVHLFLSNQDRLRLSMMDYKKASEYRSDIDIISADNLELNYPGKKIVFINDQITRDDISLRTYSNDNDYDIFISRNYKFTFKQDIDFNHKNIIAAIPSLAEKNDAIMLELFKTEVSGYRIDVEDEVAIKETLFKL